jgi:hypothetical protein
MNERIKQLADQAGIVWKKPSKDWTKGPDWMKTNPNMQLEEFAKLIILECANRASWAQDTGDKDVGSAVLKQFGVEE